MYPSDPPRADAPAIPEVPNFDTRPYLPPGLARSRYSVSGSPGLAQASGLIVSYEALQTPVAHGSDNHLLLLCGVAVHIASFLSPF